MMKYLTLILTLVSLTAKAQVPMTTENRSLGPGTYEESVAQMQGASPPSGGYRKGWQSSVPGVSVSYGGATGTVPLPNNMAEVPDD